MMVAVHRTECTIAARSRYRYTVKQYFHKMEKIAYLKIFTCHTHCHPP
jgi:hypothetical protein